MNFCPNINIPEAKALIKKLGLLGFYKEYIRNGYTIPSIESVAPSDNIINALPKIVDIFNKNIVKINQWFNNKAVDESTFYKKLQELGIPKNQLELFKETEGVNPEEKLINFIANYSHIIEINTAKEKYFDNPDSYDDFYGTPPEERDDLAKEKQSGKNSSYYSNLTVPGGINYTENEIATPLITPSIKGHAEFSTDNGIGWFRSDDKVLPGEDYDELIWEEEVEQEPGIPFQIGKKTIQRVGDYEVTKTRRILEVQSDLFQKGRDRKVLTKDKISLMFSDYESQVENTWEYQDNVQDHIEEEPSMEGLKPIDSKTPAYKQNQFLQLLNKDNNWVTFFVKSIIQDSVKKGYKKVLFPTGNTASKVEGHSTLEEFKKQKEDRIKELEKTQLKYVAVDMGSDWSPTGEYKEFPTKQEAEDFGSKNYTAHNVETTNGVDNTNEINQLKQELERVEKEGFAALRPIYNFYENTVTNILKKQGYNPVLITDEYGNTWNEVILNSNYNTIYYDIEDTTQSVSSLLLINKDKFKAHQQSEVIDSLIYQIQMLLNSGLTNANEIISTLKQDLIETESYWRTLEGGDEYTARIADNLKDVVDNFDSFMVKTNSKLKSLGITISGASIVTENITMQQNSEASSEMEESSYDTADGILQKLNYSDESAFTQSSKDTASGKLKLALSLLPRYVYKDGEVVLNEDGEPKKHLNYLYLETFEDIDLIWNDLLYTLSDVEVGGTLEHLKNSKNPRHRVIYNEITSNPRKEIINEFEVTFSKQMAKSITADIANIDDQNNKSILIYDTNRANAIAFKIDNWYESFINSKIVVKDADGNLRIDTELGDSYAKRFEQALELLAVNPKEASTKILEIFDSIGIHLSPGIFDEVIEDDKGNELTGYQVMSTKLKYFFNKMTSTLIEGDLEDSLDYNNPFINETSSLELLSKLENKINPSNVEASYISGDGKSKYSFINHSYLSHVVRKLKSDTDFLEDLKTTKYAQYSNYLNSLLNDPTFKSVFDVFYFDTLGNRTINDSNKPFKKMNDREKEFTRISLFQNQGKGTTANNSDIGYFIGLTPSDKTTIPVFKVLKTKVLEGKNGFDSDTMSIIYNLFLSEYERIKQTQEQNDNPDILKIDGYHGPNGAGNKFIIFRFLNKVLIKNNRLREIDDVVLKSEVTPLLEKFLKDLIDDQVAYWKELNLYNESIFDKTYATKNGVRKQIKDGKLDIEKDLRALASNYAINQFIFMFNQTQLISGDPALYGKNDKEADGSVGPTNIFKTLINFFKRMSKDIAPGLDGNFKNSSYNTIFLKDLEYDTALLNEYNELIGDITENYLGMNPGDAQEYTTLQEHLDVMEAYGRLSDEQKAAGQRLLDGGSDIGDIKLILQPMKPVYVDTKIANGINMMFYIKTSSFPLIPALTAGLEIDKLRLAMENPANNIQRAVYESGVKLGLQGELTKVSKDGYVKFNTLSINPKQIINLNRSGFRIQQELPNHDDDIYTIEGSQSRKLILNNVNDTDTIIYNGKELTGKEANQLFEDLHIEKMNRAFDNLLEELSFDKETGKFTDLSKIANILKEEAVDRDYSINDIYSIQIIRENGVQKFKVPIGFVNNAARFESILNSLVTNRVIKQKLPGFSKVQGSGAGFSRISSIDDTNDVVKSAIVWLNKEDTVLEYTKNEDGKLTGADILLPSWFKQDNNFKIKTLEDEIKKLSLRIEELESIDKGDETIKSHYSKIQNIEDQISNLKNSNGKSINVKEYIKEDGTLDTDRIPKELLTIIGIRIPTQGHNSMMKFNVKGFLPEYVGDLAIVPAEIVVQMGSDFDVDKLFFYRYHYKQSSNGKFTKISFDTSNLSKLSAEQLDNAIVQMFEDRLSDPSIIEQMLEPNGFGKLSKIAKKVESLSKDNKSLHVFTTREQNNIHKLNNDGKTGTGIFSLFSTFNKAAQDAKLEIFSSIPFTFKNDKGDIIEITNLYSSRGINNTFKSSVISYLQSAAVDNAKEQLLGKLNINEFTMNVAGTMALMGLDETFIGYFLSQPIIKKYVNILSNTRDIIEYKHVPNIENMVAMDLYKELLGTSVSNNDILKTTATANSIITLSSKQLLQFLEQNNNDTETAITNLSPEELNNIKNADTLFNVKVLSDFIKIKDLANIISATQSAINVDTKGLGPSFATLQYKKTQIDNVLNMATINNPIRLLNIDNLFKDTVIGKAVSILKDSKKMYSSILLQGSESYQDVLAKISSGVDLTLNVKNIDDIYKNIKSYLLSFPEILDEDLDILRDSLLKGENSLAKRWEKYSNTIEGSRNILTSRIKPKFAKKDGQDDLLVSLNTPASNNSNDIDNTMMYFYEMIENGTELEKELANDLVKYHIITGAQFSPTSIGKYISYDVLEKTNFSAKLRNIESLLGTGLILSNFIPQYFQNNPGKAVTKTKLSKYSDRVFINKEDAELKLSSGILAEYFKVKDSKTKEYHLYYKSEKYENGYIYDKLPVLVASKTSIKNYNASNNSKGSVTIEKPVIENATIKADTSPLKIESPDAKSNLKNKYNFDNGPEAILKSIIENTTNEHFRKVASDILNNLNTFGSVKVIDSNEHQANGWYDPDTNEVFINMDNMTLLYKNSSDAKFEEIFLHEMLHAGTVNMIAKYNSLLASKSDAKMISDGDFTKEQIVSIKGIKKLYEAYKNSYPDQEKLIKYIDIFNRRVNGEAITEEENMFLLNNKSELYPLVNIEEFIAAGLTSESYIKKLKQGKFWSKLIEFVKNILGLSSDLDALYNATISIIEDNTSDEESDSQSDIFEDPSFEESEIKIFVKQRDEFFRAYRKTPESQLTFATFKRIKKSAEANPKYDRLVVNSWVTPSGMVEFRINRKRNLFYDVGPVPPKSKKELFMERVLSKFENNLKNLKNRKKQLGNDAPPELSVKIQNLTNKIQELKDNDSIVGIIDALEEKISQINDALNGNFISANDLYEFKSYLDLIATLNQHIKFTDKFDHLNDKLNKGAVDAISLLKKLKNKQIELLQQVVDSELQIPFELREALDKGLKDLSGADGFLDWSNTNSSIYQILGGLIERYQLEANKKHDEFNEIFLPLLKEHLKISKNYDMFLQKDKDGNPTGFLLNKYSDEYYKLAKGNFKFYNKNVDKFITPEALAEWEIEKEKAFQLFNDEDYALFLKMHDPELYLEEWNSGKKSISTLRYNASKYVTEKIKDKWIDPNYTKLKNLGEDHPSVKLYNFIEPIIRKNSVKYGQQSNYIPEISKTMLDYFLSGNIKGGFSKVKKDLIDSLTVELHSGNNEIDEFTGELRQSIPVAMFSNTLSADEKSFDLGRIVEATVYQEYMLTAKREIEPLLNILYNVIQESKTIITKPDGTEVLIEKAPVNILDNSKYLIESFLYNKGKKLEGVSNYKINGKNIAGSQLTDAVINYVRLKGMAFNPFSAVGNIMQGLVSNFITSAGGEYFTMGDNAKAFSVMLHSIAGKTNTAKKIAMLMKKFDAFVKYNELKFGASKDLKDTQNALNNIGAFELQTRGEYFIQGQTLIALLYNSKVTVNGKEISYFEALDDNGNWKSEYGADPFKDNDSLFKYQQLVKSAIIDVHGNYLREIPKKNDWYWRMLMVFRTWLPQAINARFGAEKTNIITGRTKKGRYRSYNSFIRDENGQIDLNAIKENVFWLFGARNSTLSELDKINMRKNIAELGLIVALTLLILMLKAGIEDLDDEELNYVTYLINSLSKTQSELTFFMLPSSFEEISKNAIPPMSAISDTIDVLGASFKTITGDPVYKTGHRKGQSKLVKETLDLFPIINQLDKNLSYAKDVFDSRR